MEEITVNIVAEEAGIVVKIVVEEEETAVKIVSEEKIVKMVEIKQKQRVG